MINADDADDEIRVEFILEAREILDQLDRDFVRLEAAPDELSAIGDIFRAMHTLKGSSGVCGYRRLERLAHAAESLMGKVRDGSLVFSSEIVNALLSVVDVVRDIVQAIDLERREAAGDDSGLIDTLQRLSQAVGVSGSQNEPELASASPQNKLLTETPFKMAVAPDGVTAFTTDQVRGDRELAQRADFQADRLPRPVDEPSGDLNHTEGTIAPVKVSMEVLDKLINLTSEMVLARNRLLPFSQQYQDSNFASAVRNIDLLTRELQERMMATRMEPISQVWMKLPRMLRDISKELGKKVELVQEGEETALDRTLLDAVRDPLVHIIRNSVDHGVELPDTRVLAGKPAQGRIALSARHENGVVVIEVSDDGAGINFELIRARALEMELITSEEAATLDQSQLLNFIFLPGFSTKTVVTSVSGRGVGMDIVKTNMTKIGGSIEVNSRPGEGTQIQLRIPLTLAIMPALFVRCQQERYAIAQNAIIELLRLDTSDQSAEIQDFYGVPVFRLREQLVPLIFLSRQLGLSDDTPKNGEVLNIAVLQSSGIRFGLVIDEVLEMQDIVVKPLNAGLKTILEFAGATILGNGRVALVLDVDGIATSSALVNKMHSSFVEPEAEPNPPNEGHQIPMLLFSVPGLERLAIEMEAIDRLETLPVSRLQKIGAQDVVKYGVHVMPLINLSAYIHGAKTLEYSDQASLSVMVHYSKERPFGLVVGQFQDIRPVSVLLHQLDPQQRGLKGCVVNGEEIINVVDLPEIMRQYRYPEEFLGDSNTIDAVESE